MRLDVHDGPAPATAGGSGEAIAVASTSERGGLVVRCSVARGRSLSPGVQKTPFFWRDVVQGPPPRRREKGDCLHVTFHGTDDSGDARIAFTTIVRVDPGMDKNSLLDDIVHVEERAYVQRRLLQELIDRERGFTDRVTLRMRSRLAQNLARKRRRAHQMESAKGAAILLAYIRFSAKAGNTSIRWFRSIMRGLVAIPDSILTQTERASIHLASRSGRRWLRKAIHDPGAATPQEKAGVLVWLSFAMLAWFLVLSLVFATVLAPWSGQFSHVLGDFTGSLLGTIALPIPAEILFINGVVKMGYVLAPVGLLAGKMMGAWMLYLLGDSLFDGLSKKSGPRMKRGIAWLQRNANKWGFAFLVILNAIPLAPDALIIVFAVSGMRFRTYMVSIAVGSIAKLALLAFLIYSVGPDAVQAFMTHPIATLRGG